MPNASRHICVFCGSNPGFDSVYAQAAEELGRAIAQRGEVLVYGGGRIGLMGIAADAALEAGGRVIGVIPEFLDNREIAHTELTELHRVSSMHVRKAKMVELSEAFIALPGGLGTFDELCEILSWAQLGLHEKPVGILNLNGFFSGLIQQIDRAVAEGFCRPEHQQLYRVETDVTRLLMLLDHHSPPHLKKWLDADQV